MVELVDMVDFLHRRAVLGVTVHQGGGLRYDFLEEGHPDWEVGGPEKPLRGILEHGFHLVEAVEPSRGAWDQGDSRPDDTTEVVHRRRGGGELNGHIGREKLRRGEFGLLTRVYDTHNLMSTREGDFLNGMPHLAVSYKCCLHSPSLRFSSFLITRGMAIVVKISSAPPARVNAQTSRSVSVPQKRKNAATQKNTALHDSMR